MYSTEKHRVLHKFVVERVECMRKGVFFWFLDIFSACSWCHMSKKWGVSRKCVCVSSQKLLTGERKPQMK